MSEVKLCGNVARRRRKILGIRSPSFVFVKQIKHENSPPQADFFLEFEVSKYIFVKEILYFRKSILKKFPPAAGSPAMLFPLMNFYLICFQGMLFSLIN